MTPSGMWGVLNDAVYDLDWVEFAPDSPLEGAGFEPSVPRPR
jgi:hypothetical protein